MTNLIVSTVHAGGLAPLHNTTNHNEGHKSTSYFSWFEYSKIHKSSQPANFLNLEVIYHTHTIWINQQYAKMNRETI